MRLLRLFQFPPPARLHGPVREPTIISQLLALGNRGKSLLIAAFIFAACSASAAAQTALDAFHWADFHDSKDGPVVQWVTTALRAEKWTEIREIGVQWDSALVFTTQRATPQSAPPSDLWTVWSVSLAKHEVQPLLHGANLRILNWTTFGGSSSPAPELSLVYDDCYGCDAPSTFFTTLYYNFKDHAWRARWMRGEQAAALWTTSTVTGVTQTQVYGLLTEPPGRDVLATWTHYDYGKTKPAEDFVFEYSVDPASGLEQTQGLSGDHAEAMELRLCKAGSDGGQTDPALAELARGQDSELCHEVIQTRQAKGRPMRRPTTTPPANNHGLSQPGKPHS